MVTGTVITVIGISLLPVAIRWAAHREHPGTPTFGDPPSILVAALAPQMHPHQVTPMPLARVTTGYLSRVAILLGLVLGTVVAIPFG